MDIKNADFINKQIGIDQRGLPVLLALHFRIISMGDEDAESKVLRRSSRVLALERMLVTGNLIILEA